MGRSRLTADPKLAVGYIRVSKDEQALGPAAQREALVRWAQARGVRLVSVHEDLGVTGGTPLDQCPSLMAALDDVSKWHAGTLVVAKRDRAGRDVMKMGMLEALLRRQSATLISAGGEGEGDSPADALQRRIIDAFAEYERALIRSRTKAALAVKARRGERVGGVPYGKCLATDGIHLEDDEPEQTALRAMRALRASGRTYDQIATELPALGYQPRAGTRKDHKTGEVWTFSGRWHATQVARILNAA